MKQLPRRIVHSPAERADCIRRIMSYVQKGTEPTFAGKPCWVWIGPDSGNGRGGGYGRVSYQGQTHAVHILMYEFFNGKRRRGYQVDHNCGNRRCCNPAHLEQVTHEENQRRRDQRIKEEGK